MKFQVSFSRLEFRKLCRQHRKGAAVDPVLLWVSYYCIRHFTDALAELNPKA